MPSSQITTCSGAQRPTSPSTTSTSQETMQKSLRTVLFRRRSRARLAPWTCPQNLNRCAKSLGAADAAGRRASSATSGSALRTLTFVKAVNGIFATAVRLACSAIQSSSRRRTCSAVPTCLTERRLKQKQASPKLRPRRWRARPGRRTAPRSLGGGHCQSWTSSAGL